MSPRIPSVRALRASFPPDLRTPLGGMANLADASNAGSTLDATDAQAAHAVSMFSNGRDM